MVHFSAVVLCRLLAASGGTVEPVGDHHDQDNTERIADDGVDTEQRQADIERPEDDDGDRQENAHESLPCDQTRCEK